MIVFGRKWGNGLMYQAEWMRAPEKRKRSRKHSAALPDWKRICQNIAALAPSAAAFFLLSIAECFSIPSPYAICCLLALLTAGVELRGIMAGLGLALVSRLLWGIPLDEWQYIVCGGCFLLKRLRLKTVKQTMLFSGILLFIRALPGMVESENMQNVILHLAGILLGVFSMPALCRAAQIIREPRREMGEDDILCLLLPCLFMIAGAGRLLLFRMNLGLVISCFLVLLIAWSAGGSAGLLCGLGSGAALLIGGKSALMLIILSFGAVIAGMFQGRKRVLAAGGFLLAVAAASYLTAFSLYLPFLCAAALGCLGVLLLPGKALRRISSWIYRMKWTSPRENAYTRLKMQRWVRAIDRMADALPHPCSMKREEEEESESIAEELCRECDRLPICWHEHYDATKAGMAALVNAGGEDGYLPVINRYFGSCPRIARIPELLGKLDAERQKEVQRALCAEYERAMLQTHLTALSQAAQRISLEGMSGDGEEAYWLSQVQEALQALRFPGEAAFVKRVEGRMTVCLKCDPLALRHFSGDHLISHIGIRLHAPMQITEEKNGRILLEEEPPLMVQTGKATACAVTLERKKQPGKALDNGDAVLVQPLSGGQMVLALSDGMGHGAGAQDESRKTLELLSVCMEAGYTRKQAMTAVNGMMLSATGGEKFATVDLCVIDLWTGEAALNKLGACISVLVQGQKIRLIEGEALPLGIIEHVVPMEHIFTMGEGDLMVLLSDGITDALQGEEAVLSVIRNHHGDSPQHLADMLLQEAMIQTDGMPPDDMTVLCARICQRHPERRRREMI